MAVRAEQEDPWSGFVDVLSNVVMVVTFIVIILGIAMFALSQQIAEQIIEQMTQVQNAEETVDQNDSKSASGAQGEKKTEETRPLLQPDEFAGNTVLTIRSRDIGETYEETVAATEETGKGPGGKLVKNSISTVTLNYPKQSYDIDEETLTKMDLIFTRELVDTESDVEIRAFATTAIGSVSEARRIAYYRALFARTYLMKRGYNKDNINTVIRESSVPEERDQVLIIYKPTK